MAFAKGGAGAERSVMDQDARKRQRLQRAERGQSGAFQREEKRRKGGEKEEEKPQTRGAG